MTQKHCISSASSLEILVFLQTYHQLLSHQRDERDKVNDSLDERENEEMSRLLHDQEAQTADELEKTECNFRDRLRTQAKLSDADIARLLAIHQQQMHEFER